MIAHSIARALGVAAVAFLTTVHVAQAQQTPRPPQAPAQKPAAQPAPAPKSAAQQPPAPQPQAQQPPAQPPAAQQAQQPSPAAVALAVQLLELKGGLGAFDPAIEGVVVHHRGIFLQINPNLTRDIDATVQAMRVDAAVRRQELHEEIARGYASVYSEQDLKDLLEFFKTPLGKKIIEGEPKAGEEVSKRAEAWIEKYADDVMSRMRAEMRKKGHSDF
jgi:hypothetical protein